MQISSCHKNLYLYLTLQSLKVKENKIYARSKKFIYILI